MKYTLFLCLFSLPAFAAYTHININANLFPSEKNAYGELASCQIIGGDCMELERIVAECIENNTPPEDCTI